MVSFDLFFEPAVPLKSELARLIGAETPARPLSDETLVRELHAVGYDVARRTVAKYRAALGIPSSAGRRAR